MVNEASLANKTNEANKADESDELNEAEKANNELNELVVANKAIVPDEADGAVGADLAIMFDETICG